MATTADIRNGLCIEYNHGLYVITEFQHVKPGKGPAFVRTKLKNVKTGKVIDNTFPSGHKIHPVRVERRKYQYLYQDDMGYHFMNTETYEQVPVMAALISETGYLKDGMEVELLVHAETEEILVLEFPASIVLEVTYTEPGIKGDTATNATKPATMETGLEVQVPLFINQGEKIRINTADKSYMERFKG